MNHILVVHWKTLGRNRNFLSPKFQKIKKLENLWEKISIGIAFILVLLHQMDGIFVSLNLLSVTLDKIQWIKELNTKHVGGTHNRSCKEVPYTLDDLFKLISQQLILEVELGGVIKNSFENIN